MRGSSLTEGVRIDRMITRIEGGLGVRLLEDTGGKGDTDACTHQPLQCTLALGSSGVELPCPSQHRCCAKYQDPKSGGVHIATGSKS